MYFTGIGGFALGDGDGSYYQGPAGALLGTIAGFSASVMFAARGVPNGGTASALFSAGTGGPPPTAGWEISIEPAGAGAGGPTIRGAAAVTAGATTAEEVSEGIGARPFYIATLVVDPAQGANGATRLYLNGVQFVETAWAPADAYVPPAAGTRPSIGARNAGPTLPASAAYVLGAAFFSTALTLESVYRHQLACLEAGDMIDGTIGGAFSAGVPTAANLYSARRTNSGFGVLPAAFIAGDQSGVPVGQVPPGAATWPDSVGNPARDLTRLTAVGDTGTFTTGFKRVG